MLVALDDIKTRADLEYLLRDFYSRMLEDQTIGYIFTDAAIDIEQHLPVITDFWELALFGKGNYRNNVLAVHQAINRSSPLTMADFKSWLRHLDAAIDGRFEGQNAELMKTRALSVATVMQIKLNQ